MDPMKYNRDDGCFSLAQSVLNALIWELYFSGSISMLFRPSHCKDTILLSIICFSNLLMKFGKYTLMTYWTTYILGRSWVSSLFDDRHQGMVTLPWRVLYNIAFIFITPDHSIFHLPLVLSTYYFNVIKILLTTINRSPCVCTPCCNLRLLWW